MIITDQLKLAFDFIQFTNKHVFLTGNAGTGKTTFLQQLKKQTFKRLVVTAPTGVAAINAGGVTLHSFFQLPFGPLVPETISGSLDEHLQKPSRISSGIKRYISQKLNIIRSLDLLIIDEISMVRADLLDAVDEVLRKIRYSNEPFGGVQLLMIGDLYQLTPVVKTEERPLIEKYYETPYFFSSKALQSTDYVCIELTRIFRQSDRKFIELLSRIRNNDTDEYILEEINKRYRPGIEYNAEKGCIILTTHKYKADRINSTRLEALKKKTHYFTATIKGTFPEENYPTSEELELKVGAQVMFIKNDSSSDKKYYNGKIGVIEEINEDGVFVSCPEDDETILVGKETWENIRYELDEESREIKETVIGSFSQLPLKLAWAITIHKSQGLTFEKAIIDARDAFASGQVYVALSRCRSLEGLYLSSKIDHRSIKNDTNVVLFSRSALRKYPDYQSLKLAVSAYQKMLIQDLFNFSVIENKLKYLLKIVIEHAESLQIQLSDDIKELIEQLNSDILIIARKFEIQLKNLFDQNETIETNQLLQEKIGKASAYFLEKIKILKDKSSELEMDSDNKAVRQTVKEAFSRYTDEILKKMVCLNACMKGFVLEDYLKARAMAVFEISELKMEKKSRQEKDSLKVSHPELYQQLKAWRNKISEEKELPYYQVLPLRTIREISNLLPVSIQMLREIKGIGTKKLKTYGPEILSIVREYCQKNAIEVNETIEFVRKSKPDTRLLTLEMFKSGKSIYQIATERKLSISTVEGHLFQLVQRGMLDIHELMSEEKILIIRKWFETMKGSSISEARQALGDSFSYHEIKYVFRQLNPENSAETEE